MNRLGDYEAAGGDRSVADRAAECVSDHPGYALGLAAAAGLVVGLVAVGMVSEVRRSRTTSEKMQDFFAGVRQSVEDSVRSAMSR